MSITLRAYNVLFGDSLLVSWDEDDGRHHAWIDFGNFLNDRNDVFEVVMDDVRRVTRPAGGGKSVLDLVVVTHRHLDHMEGFYTTRSRFKRDFSIKKLWHAHVTRGLDAQFKIIERFLADTDAIPLATREGDGTIGRVFRNNFGIQNLTTRDRMDAVLDELPCTKSNQHTVHRLSKRSSIMPPGLRRLRIDVLGPERNSRAYLKPLEEAARSHVAVGQFLAAAGRRRANAGDGPIGGAGGVRAERSRLIKLADFSRLRRKIRSGGLDLLAAVDKTRNNTSIVLKLTYDDQHSLLLTGDAEEKSWEIMQEKGLIEAADCIKVAHHGSHNASPAGLFRTVFPRQRRANAVMISTDPTRYPSERFENEVPKGEVVEEWKKRLPTATRRSRLKRTDGVAAGKCVQVTFG